MNEPRSVLIDDAALLLGVCRRTVYYRIRDGRLRTVRVRGGSQRVLLSSIADLLGERGALASQQATARSSGDGHAAGKRPASETESAALEVEPLA